MNRIFLCILLGALSLPVLAQQPGMQNSQQQTMQASSSGERAQGGGHYDQQIQQEARRKLQDKDELKQVSATVDDGIVTLTGQVKTYADKMRAEKEVHDIDHASGVRNLVQVTSSMPDAQLRDKLADKLRYDRIDRGIMFNNLKLQVQNGVVTVSGQVLDYPSEASALSIVQHQTGVKDVIDEIKVLPTSNFDDDLRVQLARAIYGNSSLSKYAMDPQAPIRIVVKNGHVQLDGVVNSKMDRQIAEVQARSVPGVFSVENNLVVANSQQSARNEQ